MINSSSRFNRLTFTAALTGCFFICGCENDVKKVKELTENRVTVEEVKGVQSYISEDGKMRAKLVAPLMLRVTTDSQYVEFPQRLHLDFYNDSAKLESWLDCKYGKYYEGMNKAYLRDSVVVISLRGDTLYSADLWWDQNLKIFYTDKYAEYHTRDKNITGEKGLEATQDMTRVTFRSPTGTVQVSENGFPKDH